LNLATITSKQFEPLLDATQAAQLLHCHPKTLLRKARFAEIPGYQIGRGWFFRASELDAWLRSLVQSKSASNTRVN
jgi:excisionase family DNA binding protein